MGRPNLKISQSSFQLILTDTKRWEFNDKFVERGDRFEGVL